MRFDPSLEKYRLRSGHMASNTGDLFGFFQIPGPCGVDLRVMACEEDVPSEMYWEHVSVACRQRMPNWTEMCYVKDLFWGVDEVCMQLHPAKADYVNVHAYVLHIWRPTRQAIPLPPKEAV